MKPVDLLDIIGEVSDDYIDNAKKQTKRKSRLQRSKSKKLC